MNIFQFSSFPKNNFKTKRKGQTQSTVPVEVPEIPRSVSKLIKSEIERTEEALPIS